MLSDTQTAVAALIGGVAAMDTADGAPVIVSGDGAIPVVRSGSYVATKATAAALTIAAPAVPGIVIRLISATAAAHVLTFTGGTLRGGTAAVASATCAAQKGASLTVISLLPTEASWGVVASVAQTLA